ncbi:BA14K family protein [Sinorhizobium sp. 22678]|uniref:BA14K family protein n=1 Tax=Sinorhizobium sp. 22678 TaxID=3453955 RepID=UPI003F83390F
MVRPMKTLAIVALSLATAISSVPPAEAFPIVLAPKTQAADVQLAQFPYERGEARKGRCRDRDCRRMGNWRGYRGNRHYSNRYHHRRYYRDDDDDLGAFFGGLAAGAIVGGVLSQPRYAAPRYYGGGNAHVEWCYSRYRSYRAWDNTFQPYNGPRRQCYSPYS